MAFSAFTDIAPIMVLAIGLHNIPEGLICAAPFYAATGSKWKVRWFLGMSPAPHLHLSQPESRHTHHNPVLFNSKLGTGIAACMCLPFACVSLPPHNLTPVTVLLPAVRCMLPAGHRYCNRLRSQRAPRGPAGAAGIQALCEEPCSP